MRYCKRCRINPVTNIASDLPCESCQEVLRSADYETPEPERMKPKQQEFIDFMMDYFEMSRAEAGVMYIKLLEYRS